MTAPKLLALDTDLFDDAETLQEAVKQIAGSRTISLVPAEMSCDDWDKLFNDIITADKIITI
ncbi:MAG: hypothetical protein OER56_15670 [Hyphomicrobiales bacterium]|nr:hypothetical protein [Hyphomicrobiales bacterium]